MGRLFCVWTSLFIFWNFKLGLGEIVHWSKETEILCSSKKLQAHEILEFGKENHISKEAKFTTVRRKGDFNDFPRIVNDNLRSVFRCTFIFNAFISIRGPFQVDWTLKKHGKLRVVVLPKDGKCTKDDINKTAIVATHRWCISALPMKIVKQAAAVSDKYRNVCKDYDEPIISKQIPSPREAFRSLTRQTKLVQTLSLSWIHWWKHHMVSTHSSTPKPMMKSCRSSENS